MPRVLPTLSIAFGLTTVGCLLYAWELHGRLVASEAIVAANAKELARLRAQPASMEHRELPGPEVGPDAAMPLPGGGPGGPLVAGAPAAGRPDARVDAEIARRNSPEVRRLMALQRRATLDNHYAALFRNLKLNPADLEKFKDLLVDRQSAATDVFNSVREEGLNPRENRDQIRQLIESFEAEADASIRSTLGETGYQQYRQYEQSFPQRAVASQVEQRLSYSGTPLYGNQAEQLVGLLAASAPARPNATNVVPGIARPGGSGGRAVTITDAIVAQSAGFLSQPQVDALRQLQQEQAAQAELMQQLQQTRRNNAGVARPASPTGTGP